MLVNDTIYLLDEVLAKITRIREIQSRMEDFEGWGNMTQQNRWELEQEHAEDESYVTTFCRLANETIFLLHYLSFHAVEVFVRPEMVDRLAVMLNYFLDHLVGPKSKQLKVKDHDKYDFRPSVLLSKLVEIYINISHKHNAFLEAIIRDGRSFSLKTFQKATLILSTHKLVSPEIIQNWGTLVKNLEHGIHQREEDEQTFTDVPSEFLDPLLSEIMVDPVILPSGVTVDRPVIERHLLSNPTDPFNRKPLTVDMLVSNVELKQKIEEWKKMAKNKKKEEGEKEKL